jgi:hypothetical protein
MNQSDLSEDICQFLDAAVQAAEVLSRKTNLPLDHSHVESALVLELNLASSVDLLERHLDKDRICSILANFNFKRLFPKLLDVVHFDESIIPNGLPRKLTEVTVRANGEQWRIHQNDDDPFPSNPHAHNLSSGLKLRLGTGELYDKTRNTKKKVSRQNLEVIRARLSKFTLPAMTR